MIVYASRTGNVRYICGQINLPNIEITEGLVMHEPFVLLTYTDGLGAVPTCVESFMRRNASLCIGIAVSGNRNFGATFGLAGERLAKQYGLPLICKMDLRGQPHDYVTIAQFVKEQVDSNETIFKAQ